VLGPADKVKVGIAVTVRLIVVVSITLPNVPMIVIVAAPVVAELLALSVRVLGAQALQMLLGLNDAVTPVGRPPTESATLPPKPPFPCGESATVIVLVMLAPCTTLRLAGEAESAKLVEPELEPELLPQPVSPINAMRVIAVAAQSRLLPRIGKPLSSLSHVKC
jgi:hypothetical protein